MNSELPWFVEDPMPEIYLQCDFLVLDFETTNLDKGSPYNPDNELIVAHWLIFRDGEIVKNTQCWGSEYEQQELLQDIESVKFLVAQNMKFELGWLHRCGYDIGSKPIADTMLAEKVLAGNRKWKFDLGSCLQRHGFDGKESLIDKLIKSGVCPSVMPESWLSKYVRRDVEGCLELFLSQRSLMYEHGLLPVFYSRCLLTPVLADIEPNGMKLDTNRVLEAYDEWKHKYDEINEEMDAFTGGINPNSPDQLAEFLFEKLKFKIPRGYNGQPILTPKGKPSTNAEAIAALVPKTKKQQQFVELQQRHAEVDAVLTKYLKKMKDCCELDDGIIRSYFTQHISRSHRLTSKGGKYKIQYQNIQGILKRLYTARNPGWYVGEQDEASLEFRGAIDLARDEQGLEDLRNDHDPHSFSASVLFDEWQGKDGPNGYALRRSAKAHTFKPLYGGQSGTERQRAYYEAFKERYPDITGMQQKWIQTCLEDGRFRIPTGLIFYFPGTKYTRSGFVVNSPSICNYPVQNMATAEMVPLGLVCYWHRMRSMGIQSFITNTVHDSIITEIHPDEVGIIQDLGVQCLENDIPIMMEKLYQYEMVVPLKCETEIGYHWTETIEELAA